LSRVDWYLRHCGSSTSSLSGRDGYQDRPIEIGAANSNRYVPKLMHCYNLGSSRRASPMAHSGSPWILLSSTLQQADWTLTALSRLGSLKPIVFDLLEFTAGYHQTMLAKASSRTLTAFSAVGGWYQWIKALGKLVTEKPVDLVGFKTLLNMTLSTEWWYVIKAYKS
jgi:hypothetical protein